MLSVRRRTLPLEQLKLFRDFEASGKPMIGIRTASHAFCLRNGKPTGGLVDWPEFDSQVWGGNYSGHTKNGTNYRLVPCNGTVPHPILKDIANGRKITGHLSLYKTAPLAKSASCILRGVADGEESQPPVAWTNRRANGGQSFYTSLGHVDDFAQVDFQKLLRNAVVLLAEENPKTPSR